MGVIGHILVEFCTCYPTFALYRCVILGPGGILGDRGPLSLLMIYVWHFAGAAANRIWHRRFTAFILIRFVTECAIVVEIGFL